MENELLYGDEVYAIQGAIFDVYKEMGNAWHEEVYQQCLERELIERGQTPMLFVRLDDRRGAGVRYAEQNSAELNE